jgi:8-oxo-dGTP pyrophosphatase MutT (NUDIX family)
MSGPFDVGRVRAALASGQTSDLERSRRAAVALVLTPRAVDQAPSLLLVRRTEREGDPWSGHMALPGGHAHESDADLVYTARRETLEEVGIDLSDAQLLGRLDDVSPMRSSEIAVRPFVFWTNLERDVRLSAEVAEVVWVPLATLAEGHLRSSREVDVRGGKLQVPAYVIDERVVWGMTFHLIEGFLQRVRSFG